MKKYLVKFIHNGRHMKDEFYGYTITEVMKNCKDKYPGCRAVHPKQVKS
jgi:hypothetical protein